MKTCSLCGRSATGKGPKVKYCDQHRKVVRQVRHNRWIREHADKPAIYNAKYHRRKHPSARAYRPHGLDVVLDPSLMPILDGVMISDGYYTRPTKYTSKFTVDQRERARDWIDRVAEKLREYGVECAVTLRVKKGLNQVALSTTSYRSFKTQRERWYPDGKKIVPRDLNIMDPVFLAHWLMGDGTVHLNKRNGLAIKFCTHGFTVDDVQWLIEQFNQNGFRARLGTDRGHPTISLAHRSAGKLLDMVRPLLTPSMSYKGPTWALPKCERCDHKLNTMDGKYCPEHQREARRQRCAAWYKANPERAKANSARTRSKPGWRERHHAIQRAYYLRHLDSIRAKNREHARRYAARKRAEGVTQEGQI